MKQGSDLCVTRRELLKLTPVLLLGSFAIAECAEFRERVMSRLFRSQRVHRRN
jgi:hypothetical protein